MTHTNNILAAHAKGFGPEAIAKLLSLPLDVVEGAISSIITPQETIAQPGHKPSDDDLKEALLQELAAIALDRDYKPQERITAMREWFDRNYGKPTQSLAIASASRVTHALDDEDREIINAYMRSRLGVQLPVIDATPVQESSPRLTKKTGGGGAGGTPPVQD